MPLLAGDLSLLKNIKILLYDARNQIVRTVHATMANTYFEIGRLIIEHDQQGNIKAEYGAATLKILSEQLTKEFGKEFSVDNLENMRKFYCTYGKSETVSRKFNLSWSHYVFLMRLPEPERQFYEK